MSNRSQNMQRAMLLSKHKSVWFQVLLVSEVTALPLTIADNRESLNESIWSKYHIKVSVKVHDRKDKE